jgi:hypothetical protein
MPQSPFQSDSPPPAADAGRDGRGCARDILWGRPIFRAPELPSPRVVFDPLPFRTQSPAGARFAAAR